MKSINTQCMTTRLHAALLAAFVLGAPMLAAARDSDSGLAHNERAAQNAIASSESAATASAAGAREATLADNESASRRAIVDTRALRSSNMIDATGEATLVHNEFAAQRAIADAHATDRGNDTSEATAALGSPTVQPAMR